MKKLKTEVLQINNRTKLFLGEQGSGKTSKVHELFADALDKGISSSQIIVIVRNKTLEDLFKNKLLKNINKPLESLNVFRFRSFVTRFISIYWSYIFKYPPEFIGFSQSIMALREFMKEEPKWFGGKYSDTSLITKLFERQQRRAENCFSFDEIKTRTQKLENNEITIEADAFLEKYNNWILNREKPLLDYSSQLDFFRQLIEIDEINNDLVKKYGYLWMIEDIEDSIPVEQSFYEKLWGKVENIIYTGNPYAGVREFMGSNPLYINDLKEKANDVFYLERDIETKNGVYHLGSFLYKILNNKEENPDVSLISGFEILNSVSYGKMLQSLQDTIIDLKNNCVKQENILIISLTIDYQLQLELEYFFNNLGWEIETLKGSHILIKETLISVILTVLRIIFFDEIKNESKNPLLTGIDFSELLSVIGNIDNYHLSKLRKTLQNEPQKWLRFIDDYSKKDGFITIKTLNDLIINCKNRKANLKNPADYRDMVIYIWKTLLWKSNYFNNKKPNREFKIFLDMLENYLYTSNILNGSYSITDFIFRILKGELSDNPDRNIDFESKKTKLLTLQKLSEIKQASDYQIWFDITSDKWRKNEIHPVVNPYLMSKSRSEDKPWSLIEEDDLFENKLGKSLRSGLSLCRKKAFFLASDYNVTGEIQSNDLLGNILKNIKEHL